MESDCREAAACVRQIVLPNAAPKTLQADAAARLRGLVSGHRAVLRHAVKVAATILSSASPVPNEATAARAAQCALVDVLMAQYSPEAPRAHQPLLKFPGLSALVAASDGAAYPRVPWRTRFSVLHLLLVSGQLQHGAKAGTPLASALATDALEAITRRSVAALTCGSGADASVLARLCEAIAASKRSAAPDVCGGGLLADGGKGGGFDALWTVRGTVTADAAALGGTAALPEPCLVKFRAVRDALASAVPIPLMSPAAAAAGRVPLSEAKSRVGGARSALLRYPGSGAVLVLASADDFLMSSEAVLPAFDDAATAHGSSSRSGGGDCDSVDGGGGGSSTSGSDESNGGVNGSGRSSGASLGPLDAIRAALRSGRDGSGRELLSVAAVLSLCIFGPSGWGQRSAYRPDSSGVVGRSDSDGSGCGSGASGDGGGSGSTAGGGSSGSGDCGGGEGLLSAPGGLLAYGAAAVACFCEALLRRRAAAPAPLLSALANLASDCRRNNSDGGCGRGSALANSAAAQITRAAAAVAWRLPQDPTLWSPTAESPWQADVVAAAAAAAVAAGSQQSDGSTRWWLPRDDAAGGGAVGGGDGGSDAHGNGNGGVGEQPLQLDCLDALMAAVETRLPACWTGAVAFLVEAFPRLAALRRYALSCARRGLCCGGLSPFSAAVSGAAAAGAHYGRDGTRQWADAVEFVRLLRAAAGECYAAVESAPAPAPVDVLAGTVRVVIAHQRRPREHMLRPCALAARPMRLLVAVAAAWAEDAPSDIAEHALPILLDDLVAGDGGGDAGSGGGEARASVALDLMAACIVAADRNGCGSVGSGSCCAGGYGGEMVLAQEARRWAASALAGSGADAAAVARAATSRAPFEDRRVLRAVAEASSAALGRVMAAAAGDAIGAPPPRPPALWRLCAACDAVLSGGLPPLPPILAAGDGAAGHESAAAAERESKARAMVRLLHIWTKAAPWALGRLVAAALNHPAAAAELSDAQTELREALSAGRSGVGFGGDAADAFLDAPAATLLLNRLTHARVPGWEAVDGAMAPVPPYLCDTGSKSGGGSGSESSGSSVGDDDADGCSFGDGSAAGQDRRAALAPVSLEVCLRSLFQARSDGGSSCFGSGGAIPDVFWVADGLARAVERDAAYLLAPSPRNTAEVAGHWGYGAVAAAASGGSRSSGGDDRLQAVLRVVQRYVAWLPWEAVVARLRHRLLHAIEAKDSAGAGCGASAVVGTGSAAADASAQLSISALCRLLDCWSAAGVDVSGAAAMVFDARVAKAVLVGLPLPGLPATTPPLWLEALRWLVLHDETFGLKLALNTEAGDWLAAAAAGEVSVAKAAAVATSAVACSEQEAAATAAMAVEDVDRRFAARQRSAHGVTAAAVALWIGTSDVPPEERRAWVEWYADTFLAVTVAVSTRSFEDDARASGAKASVRADRITAFYDEAARRRAALAAWGFRSADEYGSGASYATCPSSLPRVPSPLPLPPLPPFQDWLAFAAGVRPLAAPEAERLPGYLARLCFGFYLPTEFGGDWGVLMQHFFAFLAGCNDSADGGPSGGTIGSGYGSYGGGNGGNGNDRAASSVGMVVTGRAVTLRFMREQLLSWPLPVAVGAAAGGDRGGCSGFSGHASRWLWPLRAVADAILPSLTAPPRLLAEALETVPPDLLCGARFLTICRCFAIPLFRESEPAAAVAGAVSAAAVAAAAAVGPKGATAAQQPKLRVMVPMLPIWFVDEAMALARAILRQERQRCSGGCGSRSVDVSIAVLAGLGTLYHEVVGGSDDSRGGDGGETGAGAALVAARLKEFIESALDTDGVVGRGDARLFAVLEAQQAWRALPLVEAAAASVGAAGTEVGLTSTDAAWQVRRQRLFPSGADGGRSRKTAAAVGGAGATRLLRPALALGSRAGAQVRTGCGDSGGGGSTSGGSSIASRIDGDGSGGNNSHMTGQSSADADASGKKVDLSGLGEPDASTAAAAAASSPAARTHGALLPPPLKATPRVRLSWAPDTEDRQVFLATAGAIMGERAAAAAAAVCASSVAVHPSTGGNGKKRAAQRSPDGENFGNDGRPAKRPARKASDSIGRGNA